MRTTAAAALNPDFVKDDHCPNCRRAVDSATNVDDDSLKPVPGDLSCCIGCAAVLTYQDDMTVRELTPEEFLALSADNRTELARMAAAVKEVHEDHPGIIGEV